jgi:cytochrome P450
LFVNDPDVIKHILIKNNKNYLKGVGFERVKMLLGNGIIVSDGPVWRRQRRMIQPAFGREVIAELTGQIKKVNLDFLARWQALAADSATINITEETNNLALQIILRSLFSEDLDLIYEQYQGNPFAMLIDDSARDLKLAVKFRGLTKTVAEILDMRRQSKAERMDFVSLFMDARDKETGEPMTDKELIDEVMTLIVAGSETSATTLNWTWYCLSQYPDVLAKVQQEVDQASYDETPGFEHTEELPYIRQVVEEVLRVYPPVWLFTRKAIAQDEIKGITIAPATDIFISPYFMHRHPTYWPQPEQFDPERFSEEASKAQHKTAYLPFSAGPRRCIGDFFALVESQLHFGLMTRHLTMEYIADHPIELAPEVNLRTRYPIMMRLHPRT